jgi:hypothetical protein
MAETLENKWLSKIGDATGVWYRFCPTFVFKGGIEHALFQKRFFS